jgi:SAM-dependent methyltransferase
MEKYYLELSDFSHAIYRRHPDLSALSKAALEEHYLNHGIEEGRSFNKIMNRKDFLDSIVRKGKMLEIGPLDNPQLDFNSPLYHSIDVFSKADLVKNYAHDPNVNKDKIIEPTYVITNNDYSPIKEKFDCIFSSHNIEHMPCLVVFLNNLHRLLTDNGHINLVIPDKRYCFDHYKKESDIYDVLQSYYEQNSRPRLGDVLRMRTQGTHNDSVAHWKNENGADNALATLLQNYQGILSQYNTGIYMDAHVSFFTPATFMTIIDMLNKLKLINLTIHKLYHTLRGSNEFYVILQKGIA